MIGMQWFADTYLIFQDLTPNPHADEAGEAAAVRPEAAPQETPR